MAGSIIVVDDEEDTRTLLCESLRQRGFDVEAVTSAQACLDRLRNKAVDVVVTDIQMPGMSGVELCTVLHERHPDLLPIVLTGVGALDNAIATIQAGAYDFITKPVTIDALEIAIRRALARLAGRHEVKRLQTAADRIEAIPGIAGSSAALRATNEMIHRMADSDATVLITGESGTGKELVARALHELSPRRKEPFVAINCGAVAASLLESELFGHVCGAFTDAKVARPGLFLQAGRGTIFLDEVGEMPPEMQVKLLRVLQERTVRPVGGDTETPFDARVVTATNRELEVEIAEKRFRKDLYYRINVVAISVPPLRARGGDVLVLAQHVLDRIAARSGKPAPEISPDAARKLVHYDWPGNVRELENCLERAVALCDGRHIDLASLPVKLRDYQSSQHAVSTEIPSAMLSLDDMERGYVQHVLSSVGGNKTRAARVLGIDRRSLYRRLEAPDKADPQPAVTERHR